MAASKLLLLAVALLASLLAPLSVSQTLSPSDSCNGIFLSYTYTSGAELKPKVPTNQAYRFESTLTVLNNGLEDLKSWEVFVGFQHDELLVSASGAVIADGSSFPAAVGNGTVLAGFPMTDLKTSINTAGDITQMRSQVDLVGTQFGVKPPLIPLPSSISLSNNGFICPKPASQGKNVTHVCCTKDPNAKINTTKDDDDDEFLARRSGDLTIMYDVIRSYSSSYWALVTISNDSPLGRLDNWELSWDWMRDEFINSMKGAYPSVVDATDCLFGPQGTYYADLDFANVLNCERSPTIVDLPPAKANDSTLGLIPSCCRNGTILPKSMDPSKSTSAFQMEVYKMKPNLNRSDLSPPQNWKISGSLNPDYKCGPPVRVSPSQFPDPSGLSDKTAFASWQVVCNITQPKGSKPKCCVSFSAYYNESIVPCNTCACGCSSNTGNTCSAAAPAMLLPPQALLVPFENRTAMTRAWAALKHLPTPTPMPCPDNCGVSINWHLYTDFTRGWSARITVFNWGETQFADWFAAVQLDKTAPGFEAMYSFNGTSMLGSNGANNTIFMQGLEGLNYLVGETNGSNPAKDPRIPGKQQSVISFTKKNTPGVKVAYGDGFPSKVFFNGEECSLPTIYPTSSAYTHRMGSASLLTVLLLAVAAFML